VTGAEVGASIASAHPVSAKTGKITPIRSPIIGEIGEAGFDLNLTGFDEFELGELFAERTQGRTDPDDAPEPPAHPVAEPGDLNGVPHARPTETAQ
jgi:hypothetical protein